MQTYRQRITFSPMGHMATSSVRDAIESLATGALDDGETLAVSVEGDGHILIQLDTPRAMGEHEIDGLSDSIRDAVTDCLSEDDGLEITSFSRAFSKAPSAPGV
jgi:hypothetical protein